MVIGDILITIVVLWLGGATLFFLIAPLLDAIGITNFFGGNDKKEPLPPNKPYLVKTDPPGSQSPPPPRSNKTDLEESKTSKKKE